MTEELAKEIIISVFLGWIILGFIAGIIVAVTEETVKSFSVACFWIGLCVILGPVGFFSIIYSYINDWINKT